MPPYFRHRNPDLANLTQVNPTGLDSSFSSQIRQKPQIVGLDLVRFGAALLVMFYHFGYLAGVRDPSLTVSPKVGDLASFGWVGVEVFFVISGFVIVYSANNRTAQQFLKGRVIRLFPGSLICSSITFAVLALIGRIDFAGWVGSAVLSPWGPWIDGVYWTLGVELAFYALVWLLLLSGRFDNLSRVLIALGLLSCAYWFLKAGLAVFGGSARLPIIDYLPGRPTQLLLLEHGCFFAIGGLLWICLSAGQGTLARWSTIAVCLAGGMIEIVGMSRSLGTPGGPAVVTWLTMLGLIIAALLANSSAVKFINPRFSRSLGLATYPLYLTHNAIGLALMGMLVGMGWLTLLAPLLLAFGIAFAVSNILEPMVLPIARRLLSLRSAA